MRRQSLVIVSSVVLLAQSAGAWALDSSDKERIRGSVRGKMYYLRMDVPLVSGQNNLWGAWGGYTKAVVHASPSQESVQESEEVRTSVLRVESLYYGLLVNDPVEVKDLDFKEKGRVIEVEIEGVGEKKKETSVFLLEEIDSFADFEAAFSRVMATAPLQDEHPEWSEEVREAIAEGRFVLGMTMEQAYCVSGDPKEMFQNEELPESMQIAGIRERVVWRLRTDTGVRIRMFRGLKWSTIDLPRNLEFLEGRVVDWGNDGHFVRKAMRHERDKKEPIESARKVEVGSGAPGVQFQFTASSPDDVFAALGRGGAETRPCRKKKPEVCEITYDPPVVESDAGTLLRPVFKFRKKDQKLVSVCYLRGALDFLNFRDQDLFEIRESDFDELLGKPYNRNCYGWFCQSFWRAEGIETTFTYPEEVLFSLCFSEPGSAYH